MSEIIKFLSKNEIGRQKLKKRIDEWIHLENPIVSECLELRVKETFSKCIIMPEVEINIKPPPGLSNDQKNGLRKCVREAVAQHESERIKQVGDMVFEIYMLHKKLCQIKAKYEEMKDIFD